MTAGAFPRPWTGKGLRLALHLGVATPEKPLYRDLVGSLDPIDHIRFAADLGFAGISDNGLKLRLPDEQAAMGEALARHGLAMGSFTNSPMGTVDSFWGDPDPSIDSRFARSVTASIEAGKRTGGREITLCALIADGIPFEVQRAAFSARVAGEADRVAAAGMTLAVEPTSLTRTPFFLIHHIEDALAVMGGAHPGVSLMFDTGHVHEMDGDPVPLFERHRLRINTVQIADAAHRVEPGAGRTDFVAFFGALRRNGFAGLVELEHYLSIEGTAGERAALDRLAAIVAAA